MNIILAVKHHELRVHQAAVLAEIIRDTATEETTTTGVTAAGDKRRLRGIPCIAAGVGGTQPGSNPLTELLRIEHLRERGTQ